MYERGNLPRRIGFDLLDQRFERSYIQVTHDDMGAIRSESERSFSPKARSCPCGAETVTPENQRNEVEDDADCSPVMMTTFSLRCDALARHCVGEKTWMAILYLSAAGRLIESCFKRRGRHRNERMQSVEGACDEREQDRRRAKGRDNFEKRCATVDSAPRCRRRFPRAALR